MDDLPLPGLDSPFFRERSASDSAAMGNKESGGGGKVKGTGQGRTTPRTQVQSPPAVTTTSNEKDEDVNQQNNSSCRNDQSCDASLVNHETIPNSATCDSIYAEPNSAEVEESTSYKDVSHNHPFTVDENQINLEASDNIPDLPLDNADSSSQASLKGVQELDNVETGVDETDRQSTTRDTAKRESVASGIEEAVNVRLLETSRGSPVGYILSALSHEKRAGQHREVFATPPQQTVPLPQTPISDRKREKIKSVSNRKLKRVLFKLIKSWR